MLSTRTAQDGQGDNMLYMIVGMPSDLLGCYDYLEPFSSELCLLLDSARLGLITDGLQYTATGGVQVSRYLIYIRKHKVTATLPWALAGTVQPWRL